MEFSYDIMASSFIAPKHYVIKIFPSQSLPKEKKTSYLNITNREEFLETRTNKTFFHMIFFQNYNRDHLKSFLTYQLSQKKKKTLGLVKSER